MRVVVPAARWRCCKPNQTSYVSKPSGAFSLSHGESTCISPWSPTSHPAGVCAALEGIISNLLGMKCLDRTCLLIRKCSCRNKLPACRECGPCGHGSVPAGCGSLVPVTSAQRINKGLVVPWVSAHPAWIWRVPFLSTANGLQGSSSLKKEMTASRGLISSTSSKFALFRSVSSAQERAGFLRSSFE